ncbi:hypothetical protein A2U01_0010715 [Trifolium medium]|uniref:Uncharacterized protein n=1 Tax=Trifolium medium TaxID=97028 RepID=A0A392MR85_9FABA|nr:hypothetical protein [Trifolium medium]
MNVGGGLEMAIMLVMKDPWRFMETKVLGALTSQTRWCAKSLLRRKCVTCYGEFVEAVCQRDKNCYSDMCSVPLAALCNTIIEDDWHVFFECYWSRNCWTASGLATVVLPRPNVFTNAAELFDICKKEEMS